jgi:hypothetical protein
MKRIAILSGGSTAEAFEVLGKKGIQWNIDFQELLYDVVRVNDSDEKQALAALIAAGFLVSSN